MSPEQIQFFKLIKQSPQSRLILSHFDQKTRNCDIEKIKISLLVVSSGEAHMLKFFSYVWLHEDLFDFNFIAAFKMLDQKNVDIMLKWYSNPILP